MYIDLKNYQIVFSYHIKNNKKLHIFELITKKVKGVTIRKVIKKICDSRF